MAAPSFVARRAAPVSRPHRQRWAWVAALALHALVLGVIGGWQLAPEPTPKLPVSLDVVLTTRPTVQPQAAQAIAAANQRAAGAESSGRDTAPEPAPEPPAPPAPSEPEPVPEPEPPSKPEPASEPEPAPTPEPAPEPPPAPTPEPAPPAETASEPPPAASPPKPVQASEAPSGRELLAQATASIRQRGFDASLAGGGGGDGPQQAARRAAEARYIEAWTRRVEAYGNRHYPAPEALDGQLRIRVVIGSDGQLRLAEVIQSSGHPELDRAALKTVRGAAPYRPFDSGMGPRDSLAITRVWRFGTGNNFGVR